jgi:hypothetical protein
MAVVFKVHAKFGACNRAHLDLPHGFEKNTLHNRLLQTFVIPVTEIPDRIFFFYIQKQKKQTSITIARPSLPAKPASERASGTPALLAPPERLNP